MYRREGQHRNGDGRARHIDGRAQRHGDGVGVAVQVQLFAQRHVNRDISRRAAREEGVDAAFAQAHEHQRIGVTADLPEHQQRVDDQRYQQHAADQNHQQLGIAKQGVKPGCGKGRGNQAEDTDRSKADHQLHHKGHRAGDIIQQIFGRLVTMAQREAQTHCPDQNANVVGVQQGIDRIRDHAHQQAA